MEATGQSAVVRAQPLIAVRNVWASSSWYRQLLGLDSLPEHPHRDLYEGMLCGGELILQLHAWDEEAHPNLINADAAPPGHGVLLWFEVGNFDVQGDPPEVAKWLAEKLGPVFQERSKLGLVL